MRRSEFRRGTFQAHANFPAGLILLIVGGVLLARQLGVFFPGWLISWESLLIIIGIFAGIKSRFRNFGWLILVGIGAFFMLDDFYPYMRNFVWPFIIIGLGLIIILQPRRRRETSSQEQQPIYTDPVYAGENVREDVLDVASVFGSTRKIVLSKNFKGGEVVCVFGGTEINLLQADFTNTVKIELVSIFGGVKLIVPANWEIRSETAAIFGGIDDKRDTTAITSPEKTIFLEGTVIIGGVEITSY